MDHPAEHLVFVGNLPFKASSDDLKAFFAPAAQVTDVNIVHRGTRSLGYGFVAFASSADRDAAVEKCHKKELEGREINVEAAKPKSELPPKEHKPRLRRGPRKPRKQENEPKQRETEDGVIVSHADSSGEKAKPKRKPRRKPRTDGDEPAQPQRFRRERRVPTGPPSKTTVFLANLPFALDDAGLRTMFEDYKVKNATVVVRKITGRSKGFGFLELAEEAEQKRLLDDIANDKKFISHEREIGVKVALSEAPIEPATNDE